MFGGLKKIMKLIFFGPEHAPALELMGEISPQYALTHIENQADLEVQFEGDELTVLVMDFDDENESALGNLLQEKYPHVKRILSSSVRGASDFRKHQFSALAADGYLRAPIDAGLLEEILASFQSAFLADQPENTAADRGGTIDIMLQQEETPVDSLSEEAAPSEADDSAAPPPLDPAKMKIIEQTLSAHHIKVGDDGPPPFDNSLNKKIQGVFDSVFKKSAGPLDEASEAPGLDLELPKAAAAPATAPEEIEFTLGESEAPTEGSAPVPPATEEPQGQVELESAEDSAPLLSLEDEKPSEEEKKEDVMVNKTDAKKAPPPETAAPPSEDDKQTVQFDLAAMKKELKLDGTSNNIAAPTVDLEFAAADETPAAALEAAVATTPAEDKSAPGVELSMGQGGTGLEIESSGLAKSEEAPAIDLAEAPVKEELSFELSPAPQAAAPVKESSAPKPMPADTSLEFNAGATIGETTGEIPLPEAPGASVGGELEFGQPSTPTPAAPDLSLAAQTAPPAGNTLSFSTPGMDLSAAMAAGQITQTKVVETSIASPPAAPVAENISQQDRPQQPFEYRAYLDHKKEHDEIMSHHGNELVRLSATIRNLREDREHLLSKISKLEDEKLLLRQEGLNSKAELDEVKIENAIIRKRHHEEKEILLYESQMMAERKHYYEEKIRQLQEQLSKVEHKVKLDINKVLGREKELEGQIELLRADSEAQLRSREDKIIELKKKIDLMEFDMDNMTSYEKKFKESNVVLEEKLLRVMKTLKVAMKMLDEEKIETSNVQPLRKAK